MANLNSPEFAGHALHHHKTMWYEKCFTDVTLVCQNDDGNGTYAIEAHRSILASESEALCHTLTALQGKTTHPSIYLNDMTASTLDRLLEFMYLGKTTLEQEDLDSFMDAAAKLKIDGLKNDGKEIKPSKLKKGMSGQQKLVLQEDSVGTNMMSPRSEKYEGVLTLGNGKGLCLSCGKQYSTTGTVTRHFRDLHMNAEKLKCILCDKIYKNTSSMKTHLKRHHNLRYKDVMKAKRHKKPQFKTIIE